MKPDQEKKNRKKETHSLCICRQRLRHSHQRRSSFFFKEKGIFNKEVAKSFHDNILASGGSEHPSVLYRRFRGRDADPKALLRREGLIK
jgi:hypothetical protein